MMSVINSVDGQHRHMRQVFVVVSYAVVCLVLAVLMRNIRFDDPYITYRYVDNLVSGVGFRYNPAENTLITTAPLYALLLAALHLTGMETATASYILGVIGIYLGALALYTLIRQAKIFVAAYLGGLLLLVFPLLWMTVGFETPLFIALALLIFVFTERESWLAVGMACGIAIGLRGDGFVVTGVAMLGAIVKLWVTRTDKPLMTGFRQTKPVFMIGAVALIVYAPLAIWLTAQFGSPLPSTLQTKAAQAVSGLTGFYPFTTYIEGAGLLLQAFVEQSAASLLLFLSALIGLVVFSLRRPAGYGLPLLWALAHFVGYTVLAVAPYTWYYAPLAPAVAALAVLGVNAITDRLVRMERPRVMAIAGLGALLCAALLFIDAQIITVLAGATPPTPSALSAKLLPETKVDVYERVGRWIQANTAPTATLGVTELGVMGYFGQRSTLDFLGLTQPQYLPAIRHGDYLQTLLREQPDYVALSSVNAIYDVDPQRSEWFHTVYSRVAEFDDRRFWGSPMVVWQRQQAPISTSVTLDLNAHGLGDGWSVVSLHASSREIVAGQPLFLRIGLRAGDPIGTRSLRVQPVLIAGGDGLPVSSRLVHTNQWKPGEVGQLDVIITPQSDPPRGGYVVTMGWLDEAVQIAAGNLKVGIGYNPANKAVVAPISQGFGVDVITQPITICAGATLSITLIWHAGEASNLNYTAFVQVRDGRQTIAQADAPPLNGTYPTSVWSAGELIPDQHFIRMGDDIEPGDYELVVGLYDPIDNVRLPVDTSAYRTEDGGVSITRIHIAKCK